MDSNLSSCRDQAELKPGGQSQAPASTLTNIPGDHQMVCITRGCCHSSTRCPSGSRCRCCTRCLSGEVDKFLGLFFSGIFLICLCVHIAPAFQFVSTKYVLLNLRWSIHTLVGLVSFLFLTFCHTLYALHPAIS